MIYLQYSIVIIGGALLFYFVSRYNRLEMENAPKLDFEHAVDSIYVEKIDFGRSGLKINGNRYNAFGISAYAKIHNEKKSLELYKLSPPFTMSKKANNDTLKITKNGKQYYLLISEERLLW